MRKKDVLANGQINAVTQLEKKPLYLPVRPALHPAARSGINSQ